MSFLDALDTESSVYSGTAGSAAASGGGGGGSKDLVDVIEDCKMVFELPFVKFYRGSVTSTSTLTKRRVIVVKFLETINKASKAELSQFQDFWHELYDVQEGVKKSGRYIVRDFKDEVSKRRNHAKEDVSRKVAGPSRRKMISSLASESFWFFIDLRSWGKWDMSDVAAFIAEGKISLMKAMTDQLLPRTRRGVLGTGLILPKGSFLKTCIEILQTQMASKRNASPRYFTCSLSKALAWIKDYTDRSPDHWVDVDTEFVWGPNAEWIIAVDAPPKLLTDGKRERSSRKRSGRSAAPASAADEDENSEVPQSKAVDADDSVQLSMLDGKSECID
jgi:hypothetical protein